MVWFESALLADGYIFKSFTYYILVNPSAVICWMGPFVIVGVLGLFWLFYSIFDGKSC